jgi:hypothetical protein
MKSCSKIGTRSNLHSYDLRKISRRKDLRTAATPRVRPSSIAVAPSRSRLAATGLLDTLTRNV